jgi:hypothetical protein
MEIMQNEILCPFCEKGLIKVLHKPPVLNELHKRSWGGNKKSYKISKEVYEVLNDKCPNCGKSRKEIEKKCKDPLEENWELGTIIKKCGEEGILDEPGLGPFINLINSVAIPSVHAKKKLYLPTEKETASIINFTNSVIKKLYK